MAINYQKIYDTLSYEESIEFRDLTIRTIQELYPYYSIKPIEPQSPDVIYITNQEDNVRIQFPLRDLYKQYEKTSRTKSDLKEIILNNYAKVFSSIEDSESFLSIKEPEWSEIQDYIQPRLLKTAEFDEIDRYVTVPFGEGVVTSFSIFIPGDDLTTRVKKSLLEKWNISFDEMYKKAMENFAELTNGMELVGNGGSRGSLWNERGFEYAATAILQGGMRYLIAQNVGSPFRFGIPSSHAFYCWADLDDEDFQIEMRAMIEREYLRMPSSLSTNIYEVDETGQIKHLKDQPKLPTPPSVSNN